MTLTFAKSLRPYVLAKIGHNLVALGYAMLLLRMLNVSARFWIPVLIVVYLLRLLSGSVAGIIWIFFLTLMSMSAALLVLDVLGVNIVQFYPTTGAGTAVALVIFFTLSRRFRLTPPWKLEYTTLGMSIFSLAFLVDKRLWEPGGALASVFSAEDNAAWVLTTHRALGQSPLGRGDYGPFLDMILAITFRSSNLFFPTLMPADHYANALVLVQLGTFVLLPLVTLGLLMSCTIRVTLLQLIGTQVLLVLGFNHFIQMGHLSTAVTLMMLSGISIFLIGSSLEKRSFSIYTFASLCFALSVMSATWFPISPVAIALALVILAACDRTRMTRLIPHLTLAIVTIILITFRELLTRDQVFRSDDGRVLGGLSSLLQMEGGVGDLGQLSVPVTLAGLVVAVGLWSMAHRTRLLIHLVTACWLVVIILRFINSVLTDGRVNYGVRKLETVIILTSVLMIFWVFTHMRSSRLGRAAPVVLLALLWFVAQIPSVVSFASRVSVEVFSDPKNRIMLVSQLISRNVETNHTAVCMYDAYPPDSDTNYVTYMCSRWVAALSNTDGYDLNTWRRAVLGELNPATFPQVRRPLGSDVIVIPVPPWQVDKTNHPDWLSLVDSRWTIGA